MGFVTKLETALLNNKNLEETFAMAKYMRNKFTYLGIKADKRKQILKENWNNHKKEVETNARAIARQLYLKKEREFHYCAIEILIKQLKG
ncbi:3-methyladenine DNA glycosylase AlkD [Flavobacterium sp. PL11]|nr:3-methyladenine DNA glycosylase AlkD [Flavobacterium sp. PL11]